MFDKNLLKNMKACDKLSTKNLDRFLSFDENKTLLFSIRFEVEGSGPGCLSI